jgi:hypothetical protein
VIASVLLELVLDRCDFRFGADEPDQPIVGVPNIFTASVVWVRGITGGKVLGLPFELVGFLSLSLLALVTRQVRKVGVLLGVLSLFPSRVLGNEGLLNVLVEFVQVDIGKHGTRNPALGGPTERPVKCPVFQISCLEKPTDEGQKPLIMDVLAQH